MENSNKLSQHSVNAELIREIHDKVNAIYDLLFGSPKDPNHGLILQVDRNTRILKTMGAVLIAVIPTIFMILYFLFSNKKGF